MAHVLIVEEDAGVGASLAREVERHVRVRHAESLRDARTCEVTLRACVGIVLAGVSHGDPLTWLRALRHDGHACPVLLIAASVDCEQSDVASEVDAEIAIAPISERRVSTFAAPAVRSAKNVADAIGEAIAEISAERRLTPKERQLVEIIMSNGVDRGALAEALGVGDTRAKRIVRGLLEKMDCGHLHDVKIKVLGRALKRIAARAR